ncbi:hypothetical protein pf16_110 [Pseudomonas phage pf16]|uniref:Uncharacterized protein n=1 Tax=Pseudomonas phage pf16 TaxID=1815630 RepID=A0A1S5R3Z1_9CAUD|nr:hypothetical protein FDG98_gp188 [Pseudomonas phage pf16]AND75033.1 hypothetical protein pf16_110 [Pseudomonas phage pf16]
MTTAAQFVNLLKEENVLDAMNLIKTSLSEQARAEVAKIGVEVAASFKLSEKMEEDDEQEDDENKNKSDADSVDSGKTDKE